MKKICIFLADGFEEIEGLTVVDLLRRAGAKMQMVSITGNRRIEGAHGIVIETDTLFEEMDYNDTSMLVLPGGMPGTRHLKEHGKLGKLICDFHREGKWIAAICAAPSVLGKAGILKGKQATCYPGFEEALEGAFHREDRVVVDGNLITSRCPGTAIEFALVIIDELYGPEKAKEIKAAIQC